MKKINFSILALFVAAVTYTSCDSEISPETIADPVITFIKGDASIFTEEAISVSGTIFAEGELDQVVIKKNIDETLTILEDITKFDVKTSHDFAFDFIEVQESFLVIIEATDKEGTIKIATATITVSVPGTIADPVITFTEGDASIFTEEAISVSGTIFAEGELDQVVIKKNVDGTMTTLSDDNSFDIKTSHDFVFDFVDVQETFTIIVEATDKEGTTKIADATVTVSVPETIVKTTTPIKLHPATGTTGPSSGYDVRFASLTPEFETYYWTTAVDNAADVNIMYYNGNYTKAGVSVPHFVSANVTTDFTHAGEAITEASTTYFEILTGDDAALFADWDNINDDIAINNITTPIAKTNITWTDAAGTIIAFELADGKKGVIKVGLSVDGDGNGEYYDTATDYIEFDVIVQKDAPVTK